jgi:hypothetical protein
MSARSSHEKEEERSPLDVLVRLLYQTEPPPLATAIRAAADDVFFSYTDAVRPLQIKAVCLFLFYTSSNADEPYDRQADRACALALLKSLPVADEPHAAVFKPIVQFATIGIELCKWARKVVYKRDEATVATNVGILTRLLDHLIHIEHSVLTAFSKTRSSLYSPKEAMPRRGDAVTDDRLRTLYAVIQKDFAEAQYGPSPYGLEHYMPLSFFQ